MSAHVFDGSHVQSNRSAVQEKQRRAAESHKAGDARFCKGVHLQQAQPSQLGHCRGMLCSRFWCCPGIQRRCRRAMHSRRSVCCASNCEVIVRFLATASPPLGKRLRVRELWITIQLPCGSGANGSSRRATYSCPSGANARSTARHVQVEAYSRSSCRQRGGRNGLYQVPGHDQEAHNWHDMTLVVQLRFVNRTQA